jgi:hypothetical protein
VLVVAGAAGAEPTGVGHCAGSAPTAAHPLGTVGKSKPRVGGRHGYRSRQRRTSICRVRHAGDEQVRVTYIDHQPWADGPTLRVQKHAASGKVMPGSEFPASKADDLVAAMRDALP